MNFSFSQQYTRAFQYQTNTVNSHSNSHIKNYVLSIIASAGTQLSGQISVNGIIVKQIKQRSNFIDLSTHILKGKQKIEISGIYKPASSSVQVKLLGPGTQVTQQTGGDGKLNLTLVIDVY